MPVVALDHYTIGTADLDRAVAFYESAIGLKRGKRPPFDFPGAWMYAGERPIVHLFTEDGSEPTRTGAFDHIAFTASGVDAIRARLESLRIDYRHHQVPGAAGQQLFQTDPDGVRIELTFAKG